MSLPSVEIVDSNSECTVIELLNQRIDALARNLWLLNAGDLKHGVEMLYNSRCLGLPVETILGDLETEVRMRSNTQRSGLWNVIEWLERTDAYVREDFHYELQPDYLDASGKPCWDYDLEVPLQFTRGTPIRPFFDNYNNGLSVELLLPRMINSSVNTSSEEEVTGHNYGDNYNADLNCCVHLINIPSRASDHEILYGIREGALYSYHRQEPKTPNHGGTCAVTLVFKQRHSAAKFMGRYHKYGLCIQGINTYAAWGLDRSPPATPDMAKKSRVLQFRGMRGDLGSATIESFYRKLFCFDLIEKHEWVDDEDRMVVEMAFGSVEQSSAILKHFCENRKNWVVKARGLEIRYWRDPCDLLS